MHKVTRDEIVRLSCQLNHEVSAVTKGVDENDMLYHLFAELCGQDMKFMRTWLHLFVCLHKKYFNNMAKTYLTRKGLSLDNWLDSVQDGRKGDVLTLLGLCMLIEKHALVHLHDGAIWTSLRDSQNSHDEALDRSDIHLIYLGRGNFAKMSARDVPLLIAENTPTSQSVAIGTLFPLTQSEDKAVNTMIKTGLGIAISREEPRTTITASTSTTPVTVPDKSIKSLPTGKKATKKVASASRDHGSMTASKLSTVTTPMSKSVEKVPHSVLNLQNQLRLILHPINARPGDRITVSQELLDCIPSSKYSRTTWQGIRSNIDTENDGNSSDATIPYSDPAFDKAKTHLKRRRKHQQTAKSNKSFKFKVKVHGIRREQRTYNFTCKMPLCGRKFTTTRDWNSHHRVQHGTKLKCNICSKSYPSPSSYRDHQYTHRDLQFRCQQCNRNFLFLIVFKNHRRAHLTQRLFKCFSGGCKSSFKHPQDLHRHIGKHLGKKFVCDTCGHTTYQSRLLECHQVVHQDKKKYRCSQCHFKMKYKWSLDRHLRKLHEK